VQDIKSTSPSAETKSRCVCVYCYSFQRLFAENVGTQSDPSLHGPISRSSLRSFEPVFRSYGFLRVFADSRLVAGQIGCRIWTLFKRRRPRIRRVTRVQIKRDTRRPASAVSNRPERTTADQHLKHRRTPDGKRPNYQTMKQHGTIGPLATPIRA